MINMFIIDAIALELETEIIKSKVISWRYHGCSSQALQSHSTTCRLALQ